MILDMLLQGFSDRDTMIPIGFSLISGAVIGFERELQGKDAGLRTHTLVCFASCLLTLLGLRMGEWVAFLPPDTQIVSDMSRMPHAIITGVGFLGAGVIFRNGATVQGLTTAASLWLTAALGVIFGTDMIGLGVVGLVCAIAVLLMMRLLHRLLPAHKQIRIEVVTSDAIGCHSLSQVLTQHGLKPLSTALASEDHGQTRRYVFLASSKGNEWASLLNELTDREGVKAVKIAPLDVTL